jgi:hypothetical protein
MDEEDLLAEDLTTIVGRGEEDADAPGWRHCTWTTRPGGFRRYLRTKDEEPG